MIYRLMVNLAFLAAGYYIGKEVGRLAAAEQQGSNPQSQETGARPGDVSEVGDEA